MYINNLDVLDHEVSNTDHLLLYNRRINNYSSMSILKTDGGEIWHKSMGFFCISDKEEPY